MRLEAHGMVKHFGGVQALAGTDLQVSDGEILGLIGPNGSGKSTMVNCIAGALRVDDGRVRLRGDDVTRISSVGRARRGLGRTFQNLRLFSGLTAWENVAVGAGRRLGLHEVMHLLERLGITHLAREQVANLPYGSQRRVEIARALAGRPCVLLLDEPAAGLNDQETEDLASLLLTIREEHDCSVLVVDHDMGLILRVSDRVQVFDQGRTIFEGEPHDALRQPEVVEAYLGAR